jgi:hypothetical protein
MWAISCTQAGLYGRNRAYSTTSNESALGTIYDIDVDATDDITRES